MPTCDSSTFPLSNADLAEIIDLNLRRTGQRIAANHEAAFEYDEELGEPEQGDFAYTVE